MIDDLLAAGSAVLELTVLFGISAARLFLGHTVRFGSFGWLVPTDAFMVIEKWVIGLRGVSDGCELAI